MRRLFGFAIAVVLFTGLAPAARSAKAPRPAPPIKGQVVDTRGKPVHNAVVYVARFDRRTGKLGTTTIRADRAGRFSYDANGKPGFAGVISASAPGKSYATTSRNTGGRLKFVLFPEWKLKGKIVDEKGKPVPGVSVKLETYLAFARTSRTYVSIQEDLPGLSVTTGPAGTFTIGKLASPASLDRVDVRLSVTAKGRATINKWLNKGSLGSRLTITQPRESIIEGTLWLPGKTGPAPPGTSITVQLGGPGNRSSEATVGSEGRFRIAALPPGSVNLALSTQGRSSAGGKPRPWVLPAVMGLELKPGAPVKLDLVLQEGALVKGKVVVKTSGKPVPKTDLAVFHAGAPRGMSGDNASTDAEGEFAVRVAAGDVTIAVYGYAYPEPPSASFKVADGEVKTGVEIKVQPDPYEAMNKPIPPDFELTPGTYELAWDPELDCYEYEYPEPAFKAGGVLVRLKAKPEFKSKNVKLEAYRLDGKGDSGLLAVAMDESKGTGKGFDLAYTDCNRNFDLTDDPPLPVKPDSDGGGTMEWVTVQSRQGAPGGAETHNPVQIRLNLCDHRTWSHIIPGRKGGWKGKIQTNKGPAECVFFDINWNGICGEPAVINEKGETRFEGDGLFIDTNGFGCATVLPWSPHKVALSPVTKVGLRFYRIASDATGGSLTIEPYAGPMGELVVRATGIGGLSGPAMQVGLAGPQGSWSFEKLGGKPVRVPAGACKLKACDLDFASGKSGVLSMSCELSRGIELAEDAQQTVDVGGKISAAISPDKKQLRWKLGTTEDFDWIMKIGDGVTVNSISGSREIRPKVKFLDRKGRVLATKNAGST